MRHLFITFLFTITCIAVEGQTYFPTCIDTTLIQIGPPCTYADYNPVCGCDSVTYPNDCFAYYNGVINRNDGICEPVDFRIYPNPVSELLNIDLITRYESDVNFYIMDLDGGIQFYNIYPRVDRMTFNLNVSSYDRGVYVIVVESLGYFVMKKFVKYNPY